MSTITNMLNSIKADLTSRRLMPVVALLCVLLLAAIGFAVIGGKSTPTSTASLPGASAVTPTAPGPAVSQSSPTTDEAVAETTNAVSPHGASSRDPFKPLPGSGESEKSSKTSSSSAQPSSSASSSSSAATSKTASSSTTPAPAKTSTPTPKPKPKPKPKAPVYQTTVLMGVAPTPPQPASPQTYQDVKRLQPLPNAQDPRIAFMGVSQTGKGAIFSLISEPILKGPAACLPSASQCEAIDLAVGVVEELEYIEADGQPVVYQLQVQSITKVEQSATTAHKANSSISAAGRQLIDSGQLVTLRGMRYSPSAGVLVLLEGQKAFAAKAHAAHESRR